MFPPSRARRSQCNSKLLVGAANHQINSCITLQLKSFRYLDAYCIMRVAERVCNAFLSPRKLRQREPKKGEQSHFPFSDSSKKFREKCRSVLVSLPPNQNTKIRMQTALLSILAASIPQSPNATFSKQVSVLEHFSGLACADQRLFCRMYVSPTFFYIISILASF